MAVTANQFCKLEVKMKAATFEKDVDRISVFGIGAGNQDPYVILRVGQDQRRSKTIVDGGKNPNWNETFEFLMVSPEDVVQLDFYDANMVLKDTPLGCGEVRLQELFQRDQSTAWQLTVPIVDKEKPKARGEATVLVSLQSLGTGAVPAARSSPQTPQTQHPGTSARVAEPGVHWVLPHYKNKDVSADYSTVKVLGRGTFGVTHLARRRVPAGREQVAIKVISKKQLKLAEQIADVQREVQILHHLTGHPNVIRLEDVYEDRKNVSLVMEVCTGGELFEAIVKRGKYSERDAAALIRSIVGVVAHCHNMGVVHRDLKPENFLLSDGSPTATLKAIDFGLSTFFQEGKPLTDFVGSVNYMAPEMLRRSYGKEADIWSCGVILYILLSGCPPFKGDTEKDTFKQILRKPIEFGCAPWPSISAGAKDCIRRMLERDPKKRATAQQILQHDWMRENGCASDAPIQSEVVSRIRNFNATNRLTKEALKLIVRSLPLDEIKGLRELFMEIDTDGSGTISAAELRTAMKRKGGQHLSVDDVAKLIEEADVNGDGQVDYEEFLAATVNRCKVHREELLIQAFRQFDADGDGEITRQELFAALSLRVQGVDPREIEEIIDQVDANGDGKISYTEFVAMMRSST